MKLSQGAKDAAILLIGGPCLIAAGIALQVLLTLIAKEFGWIPCLML